MDSFLQNITQKTETQVSKFKVINKLHISCYHIAIGWITMKFGMHRRFWIEGKTFLVQRAPYFSN